MEGRNRGTGTAKATPRSEQRHTSPFPKMAAHAAGMGTPYPKCAMTHEPAAALPESEYIWVLQHAIADRILDGNGGAREAVDVLAEATDVMRKKYGINNISFYMYLSKREPIKDMSDTNDNVGDNDADASTTGFGTVDWSSLVIEQNDDDGFNVPVAEDHLFAFLGLRDEDERPAEATSLNDTSVDGTNIDVAGNMNYEYVDTEGAAIPVDDHVSEEENIDYDMDNPTMEEGSTFPSMEVFRVAIKKYAITGEFDIGTLRSEPGRFEGICKAEGCKWKIKAKKVQHEGAIMVTNVGPDHYCLTSSRKPSTSVKVAPYLLEYHNLLWMRCAFNPDIKCDSITNNLAETFNSWIRDIKDLPIAQLADKLTEKIMVLFKKRRAMGVRLQGKVEAREIQYHGIMQAQVKMEILQH
ncbi:hypothetical protein ACQ4PT_033212 [Festuca glaucescens]